MINLMVQIQGKEKSYPIFINNLDLSTLKESILGQIEHKNYIVVINQTVHKLYSKVLDFPKDKIFVLKELQKLYKNSKFCTAKKTKARGCYNCNRRRCCG